MQTIYAHSTGFVPYSGGAIGAADAHIARVAADGGQGVDSATVTAFFNLFANQQLPSSMLSFVDPFLGYKLSNAGRIIKLYSATGAAGDAVEVGGVDGPALLGSALNGRPGISWASAALRVPSLELSPAGEWMLLGVLNDVPDGAAAWGYSPSYGAGLQLLRQYGNLQLQFSPYFGGPSILLGTNGQDYQGPGHFQTFNFSWKKYRTPVELVGLWRGNEVVASSNTDADKFFAGSSDFLLGQNQNVQLRLNTLGLFNAEDLSLRPLLNDFLKSYYGL